MNNITAKGTCEGEVELLVGSGWPKRIMELLLQRRRCLRSKGTIFKQSHVSSLVVKRPTIKLLVKKKKKQSHRPKSSICKMLAISDRMAGCYVHVDGHRDDRDDERGALDNQ